MAQLLFEPNPSKNNSGVWMGLKGHRWRNSFSRCCNEFFQSFYLFIFGKICWKMRFLYINSVHNQFQSIQWFIFKVWQWIYFRRFDCDLKDIHGSTHFWTGVWIGFKGHRWRNSFSRCCNDLFQSFYLFIFGKICWKMRFLSINYVRNQFQSIQWFIFKVRQWFFRRFECDLKDIDGSTHFWTDRKTYLAFEWDLRDIDGATHFQGIAMTLQKLFHFVVKICWKMRFLSTNSVHNQF